APQPPPAGNGGAESKPRFGGTLKTWATADPDSWDVSIVGNNHINDKYEAYVYESLLGFKYGPDVAYGDLVLRPELAERWEVSPDARTFTYSLRKGARFAPSTGSGNEIAGLHGREATSSDVKFTFEYLSRMGEFKEY